MKTTDFNKELTSRTIAENLEKQFGGKVNLDKYNREQLEDFRNKLRTRIFQQEGSSKMNDLLTNETYQKDQAMLQLLNTRIKEMLGEDIKKLKDKMVELSEAKKGVRAPKHTAKAKGSKPDFLDLDKDGNKTEPMKKAARDAKFGKTFQEAMKKKCCCATKGEDSCPVHGMKEGFPTVDDAKKAHAEKTGTGKFDKKETGTGTVYTRKAKTFDNGTEDKPKEKKVKESKSCANGHTKMTKGCDECMGMWESTGDYSAKAGHPFKEAKEKTMSRAAKGVMKYGKEGMKALAKAGKEGKSLEPVKAKYNKYDESTKQRISENLDRLLSHYPKEVEHFKQGGELDSDLQDALWDYYFTNGEIRNYDADASEFIADRLAYHLGIDESLKEGKPSAGLSAAKKSAVVKKAKAGGDIGKPGKSFDKVAKSAGGGEKGEKIAAAAMWKNMKETVAYMMEKKAASKKDLPGNQEKIDVDHDGKIEASDLAKLRAKKETKESTDFTRMQEQMARLNRTEQPMIAESREVDQIRALTKRLLG